MSLILPEIRRFVIFGLGKTGSSVVRFLVQSGRPIAIYDDNSSVVEECVNSFPEVTVFDPRSPVDNNDLIIVSPGISKPSLEGSLTKNNSISVRIVSAFDLFSLYNPDSFYIGITGTNGKSTTTAILYHLMDSIGMNVTHGGNIGIPYFDMKPSNAKYKVLEMSSYELENTDKPIFDIGIITNLHPSHLSRHKTFESYVDAKLKIITQTSKVILNADDTNTVKVIIPILLQRFGDVFIKNNVVQFSTQNVTNNGISIIGNNVFVNNTLLGSICLSDVFRLNHNKANFAAAVNALFILRHFDLALVNSVIQSFTNLEHRCEFVCKKDGICFINDSKATNFFALTTSIEVFSASSDKLILMIGGQMTESAVSNEPWRYIPVDILCKFRNKIAKVFIFGQVGNICAAFIEDLHNKTSLVFESHSSIEESALSAYKFAKTIHTEDKETYILFTPGYQSFDSFNSFEHRGIAFKKAIFDIIALDK